MSVYLSAREPKAIVMARWLDRTKGEYNRVYDYQEELLRSNPGSTIVVKLDKDYQDPVFQRFYVCLNACKKGFLAGCRKVIGLDGCFLKGATTGVLLCAIGRDGNNQIYPIAWAVVEMETNDSWDWFCYLLCKDLQIGDGDGWVIISDQQKGILNSVQTWLPKAEHRNCARHIYANWRKKFKKKEYQKMFWKCAKAPCITLFNIARAELAEKTPQGAQAIMNIAPHHWSRAWIKLVSNCDSVDNNICESFNKWIVEARYLPIISMLEAIRCKVMIRIHGMINKSARWQQVICPNILRKLKGAVNSSTYCHAICCGRESYEVQHNDQRWTVDLKKDLLLQILAIIWIAMLSCHFLHILQNKQVR